jgi:2-C-methyl-D-erythritol 2,4-cyclodiphosphate synthase
MRIGLGYDIHRLIPSRERTSIPIGSVPIPCFFQVEAHSDGDVLLHALTDACLGALALGDIGQWFPDNAPENKGKSSSEFLKQVLAEVKKLGYRVAQCDTVIMLEEPKIKENSLAIREGLARLFELELNQISVKAKTMEGLGAIGERKAIAAQAIVLLQEAK